MAMILCPPPGRGFRPPPRRGFRRAQNLLFGHRFAFKSSRLADAANRRFGRARAFQSSISLQGSQKGGGVMSIGVPSGMAKEVTRTEFF